MLLRNRPLDIWMHEQDARRAVGMPGGMDTAPAKHTAEYLAEAMGFVLAKKVAAAPGTTLVLDLEGSGLFAFAVNDANRGERLAEVPSDPTVTLAMDRESFICLSGGRGLDSLERAQAAAEEVRISRCVDQLKTRAIAIEAANRRIQGMLETLFLRIEVGHRRPTRETSLGANRSGLQQQRLEQQGFAGGGTADQGNVADVPCGVTHVRSSRYTPVEEPTPRIARQKEPTCPRGNSRQHA